MTPLERFRLRLARADALLSLSALGLASGALTAVVIVAFRLLIESAQGAVLPEGRPENYEDLPWQLRLLLPLAGAGLIAVLARALPGSALHVGVVHVMERLARHQGYLPLRNAVAQFFGAALAIGSGFSVGREGPGVHLGAAGSSLLGQWLALPNNSIRMLVACGVAASIAASFNTPVAGVIFAMEVVMLEYTIVGFTPVILAAVAATSVTRLAFGPAPAFVVPGLNLASLWELPYIVLLGTALGALAAGFIVLVTRLSRWSAPWPLGWRMAAAALATGLCALAAPQIMGIGYDTVELALLGQAGLASLALVAVVKLLATSACVGLGVPGGLIGPTLVMGAAAGGALGILGHALLPAYSASPGLYAVLGMAAMMGATLQAPLAALMAVLELTANPNIILPGMLAIVAASLAARRGFGQDSVFITVLRARGTEYRPEIVATPLSRTGVAAVMDRSVLVVPGEVTAEEFARLQSSRARWVLVMPADEQPGVLLTPAALARHAPPTAAAGEAAKVDLRAVPGAEPAVIPMRFQATLREAEEALNEARAGAAYVTSTRGANRHVYGILTREAIAGHRPGAW